ncbi:OsmC family protein [Actinomadura madurae]|uniref:OsmC family protein n=2 Tax=Actinomadura madurae TaxID=1993 RepID=UPI00202630BD|nr:OsmC family protein [Actinomadura madurae]MCP9972001.1 OsmC family protein [Actinomadura madurae]URN02883.1 OsmC family protein [Actinomadura madurae]
MGEMLVVHRENDAFAVLVRDHVIHVDQPYGAGGMDIGPTPVELFVASLAARAAYYARRFLARRGLPATGLEVTAGYVMGPGVPARVSRIDLRLRPPTRLSEGDADGLLAAVEVCTVDNALLAPPNIGVRLETEARVA